MKNFVKNIFQKIKDTGVEKIDTSYLENNSWFFITEKILTKKIVYIFRKNGDLLISENGDITKAKWENLIHATTSIIIEINGKTTLYNIVYLTSEYLVIQKDGTEEVKVFIKQKRYISKLPVGNGQDPVEIVFKDLNFLLNDNNLKTIENNLGKDGEAAVLIEEKANKDISVKNVNNVDEIEKEEFEELIEIYENEKFEYHDLLKELEKIKEKRGTLTKEEEVAEIIKLQEREEDLISRGKVCSHCKAISSISNNYCRACGKKQ